MEPMEPFVLCHVERDFIVLVDLSFLLVDIREGIRNKEILLCVFLFVCTSVCAYMCMCVYVRPCVLWRGERESLNSSSINKNV